jgi:hypothetical protein
MQEATKRNALMPWLIGAVIVAAADIWVAFRMYATDCPAPGIVEAIVVLVVPAVYLALMYLTLKTER